MLTKVSIFPETPKRVQGDGSGLSVSFRIYFGIRTVRLTAKVVSDGVAGKPRVAQQL